jgi:hypothetical protein
MVQNAVPLQLGWENTGNDTGNFYNLAMRTLILKNTGQDNQGTSNMVICGSKDPRNQYR